LLNLESQGLKLSKLRSIFFCLIYLSILTTAFSQDYEQVFETGAVYEIILYNKTVLVGIVTEFSSGQVTIETTAGTFTVMLKDIRKIKGGPERKSETNLDWYASPKRGNYLYAPSSIPMDPNEFNYQNSFVVINSLNYGVTNSLVIGGGFEFISLLLEEPIYYLIPRFTFPVSQNWHAGIGVLILSIPALDINLANLYGMATYGNADRNFTIGLGYGYSNKSLSYLPTLNLSAIFRLSRKIALITENWYVQNDYMLSYGMRLMFKRIALDFTFLNNHEIAYQEGGPSLGIPFVTFMIRLGKMN